MIKEEASGAPICKTHPEFLLLPEVLVSTPESVIKDYDAQQSAGVFKQGVSIQTTQVPDQGAARSSQERNNGAMRVTNDARMVRAETHRRPANNSCCVREPEKYKRPPRIKQEVH